MSTTPFPLTTRKTRLHHPAAHAGLLLLGMLMLAPANADERMKTEVDSNGTPTAQESASHASSERYSTHSSTGSHSTRTADSQKGDDGATYQQDSQPQASKQAKESATRKVQKSVTGGDKDSNGNRQATTGGAKPTENWFGCSPEGNKQSGHCDGN